MGVGPGWAISKFSFPLFPLFPLFPSSFSSKIGAVELVIKKQTASVIKRIHGRLAESHHYECCTNHCSCIRVADDAKCIIAVLVIIVVF